MRDAAVAAGNNAAQDAAPRMDGNVVHDAPAVRDAAVLDAAGTSPAASTSFRPEDLDALATHDPLPDCRADGFVPPDHHPRWLAFRGAKHYTGPSQGDPPQVYVVKVDEHGPGKAYAMGPSFSVEGWAIGEWSDDGRYFGFVAPDPDNGSFTRGSYVVDTADPSGPVAWHVSKSATFYHWARNRSLFVLEDADGFHFRDAADHTRDTLIPATINFDYRLVWSADGRYGAITAGGQLLIVDLEADDLTQLAFMTASRGAPQWARSGHRVIFLDGEKDQLLVLNLDSTHPKPVVLAQAETTNESAELITRWLDADRVAVFSSHKTLQIVGIIKGRPHVIEELGPFSYFKFLGGNRCLVYQGSCLPNGNEGACLMSLDPDASREPRPVYPGWPEIISSPAGSPVLFSTSGPDQLLVEARFDGTPYAPSYVVRPAATPKFRFFSENPRLSAAATAPWVHFIAAATDESESHSYFWNDKLGKLINDAAEGGLSFDDLGVFSPDGQDYAATARDPSLFPPAKLPLVILRPHSDAPTEQWQTDVFALEAGFADWNIAWAP